MSVLLLTTIKKCEYAAIVKHFHIHFDLGEIENADACCALMKIGFRCDLNIEEWPKMKLHGKMWIDVWSTQKQFPEHENSHK